MTSTLETLVDIAAEAAGVVREVYEQPFSVEWKAPKDPVTAADKRANDLICARLAAAFPGTPVVAEESDPASFADFRKSERVFFVDPLDGTAEFIDKNGEFAVMIGLVEGDVATVGVVCAPASRLVWVGERGRGSFRITESGARESIRVSQVSDVASARAVSSRSHRSPALERALGRLGCREVVALGSAGLKGARVAEGGADVYLGPGRVGKRWDACAIDAIVTGAGGRFTDQHGDPFDYRGPSLENARGLAASNGLLHESALESMEER